MQGGKAAAVIWGMTVWWTAGLCAPATAEAGTSRIRVVVNGTIALE